VNLPEPLKGLGLRRDGMVALVNSRDVGEKFEKDHKNVLRDIRAILATGSDLSRLNWFRDATYVDDKGELRPSFDLTRDGFTLLVQGWTGPKALEFKIRYIEAFNAMEEFLRSHSGNGLTQTEFLQAIREIVGPLAIRFDNQDAAIIRVEDKVDRVEAKVETIERHIAIRRRAKPKPADVALIVYAVWKLYGGKCPVTGKDIIALDGTRIKDKSEVDHFYSVDDARLENLWLVWWELNQGLKNGIIARHTVEVHFKGFQEKLSRLRGCAQIITFPKAPPQGSLF
jgi:Rha family phage regulatory protein